MAVADGVIEVDASWRIRYANPDGAPLIDRDLWEALPELEEPPFTDGGLLIIFRDISDTRALLDAVMHFSTSMIYAKDPEGRFTLANPTLERMLGSAPGTVVGKTDHDIFPAEFADPFRDNDRWVLRERRPLVVEEQLLVDGQVRTNLSVKFPLERRDGSVFGTGGVSTDITERVRHQQETTLLAEVGLKLNEALDWDASLAAIVDVVAEQFADYCVLDIFADGEMRRQAVAARDPARLPQLRATVAFTPDLTADNSLTRALRSGKIERVLDADAAWLDSIARTPEHRAIIEALGPRSVLVVPLVAGGRTLGLLEIISVRRRFDERDQETAEELGRLCGLALHTRRANEQLRREGSLRELFMGVLAHDLRNPLHAIHLGAATLAARRDQGDAVARVAKRIVASADRMAKMIEQVLDLTRARAMGGIPVERRPTALGAVVEAVVDEVRAAHPARVIDVVVRGDCDGEWDPDRLAQAVSNLVGNAVTHGTADTPVHVELVGGEREVTLTVHNQSAPIPFEALGTLFDPFRRGTTSSRAAAPSSPRATRRGRASA